MANENELERSGDAGEHGRVSNGVNDNGRAADDSHFQLRETDLIMPGLLMTAALVILWILVAIGLSGCATSPAWPPPGDQQKTAPVSANQNCIINCSVQVTQETALEDIKNNAGPVTGGTQSQSATQSNTQTVQPTTTVTKDDGVPKP
jgi:hypothetical protein